MSSLDGLPSAVPGRHNDLTDVAGIRVGHHHRRRSGWLTGTTVVLPPPGTFGSVDVRGGGPSTRETDALAATTLVETVDAVVLSGGSSYGLAASHGVMEWLEDRHVGYPVGPLPEHVVPIVGAACLFDLGAGGNFSNRPDASFGRAAAEVAAVAGTRRIRQGSVGAGTGARAGGLKGGLGSASVVLASGITVAALVAVNSGGSLVDLATGELYGARYLLPGELPELAARRPPSSPGRGSSPEGLSSPGPSSPGSGGADAGAAGLAGGNTLLAVVATDAALAKHECTRLAMAAHDGMARAVRPIHNMTDGDVAFSLATGTRPLPTEPAGGRIGGMATRPGQLTVLMTAAADVVARAVVHAAMAATSARGMVAYRVRYLSDA